MNFLLLASCLLSFSSLAHLPQENSSAVLKITCQELLDSATYRDLFSDSMAVVTHNRRKYTAKLYSPDNTNLYTNITFEVLEILNSTKNIVLKLSWENFLHDSLVGSETKMLLMQPSEAIITSLDNKSYRHIFRNSCVINYIPE